MNRIPDIFPVGNKLYTPKKTPKFPPEFYISKALASYFAILTALVSLITVILT